MARASATRNMTNVTRSQFAESFFYLNGSPFSLDDYSFMRPIYDLNPNRVITLCTSRQVSKCEPSNTKVLTYDGVIKRIDALIPGDGLLSFNEETQKMELNRVKAVEDNGTQPIYEIKTRTGRTAKVTANHPFWTLNPRWTTADQLMVGDLIGLCKTKEKFIPKTKTVPDVKYILLSYVLRESTNTTQTMPDLFFKLTKEQIKKALQILCPNEVTKFASIYILDGVKELLLRLGIQSSKNTETKTLTKTKLQTAAAIDIEYDRIVSIKILDPQPTTAVEMEDPYKTYLVDDLITHNSTALSSIILANSCLLPRDPTTPGAKPGGFRSLYVSPSVDQTKIFSYDRMAPAIEESPFIKTRYYNRALRNNVFNKTLMNRATIYLRYALLSPDRLRGLSVDSVAFDEAQDLLLEVMEIIVQSMFTSKYKWQWITGTPKRRQGTLAKFWKESTQNEWAVKCQHCGKHNILTEYNIGKESLVCRYCDKQLDPRIGIWVTTNPKAREQANVNEGFRISQLQFSKAPWLDWKKDIVHKYENESRGTFFNEVLGLAYDDGTAYLTDQQVKACCSSKYNNGEWFGPKRPTFMGIDWGPANSTISYTVVVILTVDEHLKPIVLYMKRFSGIEASFENLHEQIPKIAAEWNVKLIGADRGMGEASNAELRKRLGNNKIYEFQHSATLKQKEPSWTQKAKYFVTNRNAEMAGLKSMIVGRQITLPSFESIKSPFVEDLTCPSVFYDEQHNKMAYVNEEADDTIHALIFGLWAARIAGAFQSKYIY